MKQHILDKLETFRDGLRDLRKAITKLPGERVNRLQQRNAAEALADMWVEELRSPLEHKFTIPQAVILEVSECVKQLHVLSRPSNLKSSYISCINKILSGYDDRLILPIKLQSSTVETKFDLVKLLPSLIDPAEQDYMKEAINCANAGFHRAAIVLGWCAMVAKIQKKIIALGYDKFNAASRALKNQTSGKFKSWNKEFSVKTPSELQSIFDTDLLIVLEGMGLMDGNQSDRLRTCFQYRNHSAHPGEAPIGEDHIVVFFKDIDAIVLTNPRFS